ncbi:hypothetical protein HDU76_005773 [Blyttiomyces sp. JEL0837]|nr:hypothetical protein HDU76_005773 [Blyttiomyces sp. JEL0837]
MVINSFSKTTGKSRDPRMRLLPHPQGNTVTSDTSSSLLSSPTGPCTALIPPTTSTLVPEADKLTAEVETSDVKMDTVGESHALITSGSYENKKKRFIVDDSPPPAPAFVLPKMDGVGLALQQNLVTSSVSKTSSKPRGAQTRPNPHPQPNPTSSQTIPHPDGPTSTLVSVVATTSSAPSEAPIGFAMAMSNSGSTLISEFGKKFASAGQSSNNSSTATIENLMSLNLIVFQQIDELAWLTINDELFFKQFWDDFRRNEKNHENKLLWLKVLERFNKQRFDPAVIALRKAITRRDE